MFVPATLTRPSSGASDSMVRTTPASSVTSSSTASAERPWAVSVVASSCRLLDGPGTEDDPGTGRSHLRRDGQADTPAGTGHQDGAALQREALVAGHLRVRPDHDHDLLAVLGMLDEQLERLAGMLEVEAMGDQVADGGGMALDRLHGLAEDTEVVASIPAR